LALFNLIELNATIRVILPNFIINPLAWLQGGLKPFQALIRR